MIHMLSWQMELWLKLFLKTFKKNWQSCFHLERRKTTPHVYYVTCYFTAKHTRWLEAFYFGFKVYSDDILFREMQEGKHEK